MNIARQAMETLRSVCITPEAYEDIEIAVREWVMAGEERGGYYLPEALENAEEISEEHNQKVTPELKEAVTEYYDGMLSDAEEGFYWNGSDYDASYDDDGLGDF
jgi:hypothetical protein